MRKMYSILAVVVGWLSQVVVANAAPTRIDLLACTAPSQGAISCTWPKATTTAPGGLLEYSCKRSTANITELNWASRTLITPMPAGTASSPSLSVTGLPAATDIWVACKSRDSNGWSILSAPVVKVTTQAAGALPSAPSTISVAPTVLHSELNVWWAIASGTPTVSGYRVYRSLTQNGTYVLVGQTNDPTVQAIPVGGLNADTEYWFTVAAANANGEGPRSAPAMGRTVRSVRDVSLAWNAITGNGNTPEVQAAFSGYTLYYWSGAPGQSLQSVNLSAGLTTYTLLNLGRYDTWYFCLDGNYGSYGHSYCSNVAVITSPTGMDVILESPAYAPSGLVVGNSVNTGTTTRDVTFNWTPPVNVSGLLGYNLYRGPGPATFDTVVSIPAGTTTHVFGGLSRTASYYVMVEAVYAWGRSRPADPYVAWKTE